MSAIRFHAIGPERLAAELSTDRPAEVREMARLCQQGGMPFRLQYPQSGAFRYPMAASFISR